MARRGKIVVRGTAGVIENLQKKQRDFADRIREVNESEAPQVRDLARSYAPVDEGNLRDSLTYELSKQGQVFAVFHDADFYPDEPYYIFQELGFHHWLSGAFIANPHLQPAWEERKNPYRARMAAALRREL